MTAPAPSPMTNPSRPRSNGREAAEGSSLRVDRARIAAKPPTRTSLIPASDEPAIITSASPRRIISHASPRAWPPVAQADETAKLGPRAPKTMAAWPAARLGIAIGMKNGLIRSGPFSTEISGLLGEGGAATDPGPEDDPGPFGEEPVEPIREAGVGQRLARRHEGELRVAVVAALLLAVEDEGRVEVRDLAGDPRGHARRVEGGDRPMPERPAMRPSQVVATSPPRAVTIPSPVTTTRRGPAPRAARAGAARGPARAPARRAPSLTGPACPCGSWQPGRRHPAAPGSRPRRTRRARRTRPA